MQEYLEIFNMDQLDYSFDLEDSLNLYYLDR